MSMKPPDTIPAVHFPHPGASYNPKFEDHQVLIFLNYTYFHPSASELVS
jgi:hypothetical protein